MEWYFLFFRIIAREILAASIAEPCICTDVVCGALVRIFCRTGLSPCTSLLYCLLIQYFMGGAGRCPLGIGGKCENQPHWFRERG